MRILVFPGMGANARMHARLASLDRRIVACDWPGIPDGPGFADLAHACIARHAIGPGDAVAGSSMGGMIAAEIHAQVGTAAAILIGSCLTPTAIPLRRLIGFGERLLHDDLLTAGPARLLSTSSAAAAFRAPPGFIRWALRALDAWPGLVRASLPRLHAIHGRFDAIIPLSRVRADRVIPGGHLIAVSHPRLVHAFIRQRLDAADPATPADGTPLRAGR